jgi:hypothetical protein
MFIYFNISRRIPGFLLGHDTPFTVSPLPGLSTFTWSASDKMSRIPFRSDSYDRASKVVFRSGDFGNIRLSIRLYCSETAFTSVRTLDKQTSLRSYVTCDWTFHSSWFPRDSSRFIGFKQLYSPVPQNPFRYSKYLGIFEVRKHICENVREHLYLHTVGGNMYRSRREGAV